MAMELLDNVLIFAVAAVTGFIFLFSSWGGAYKDSLKRMKEAELKAKMEGDEAYARWLVLNEETAKYKEKGMSPIVWAEILLTLVLGAFTTWFVIDQWLAPLTAGTVGTGGLYIAAAVGGIVLAYVWDFAFQWLADYGLDKLKIAIYDKLNGIDVSAKVQNVLNSLKKK